jgi:putative tryptophan/tyrosine transport system substrate-binding protein
MHRREFIAIVGGVAAALPLATRAPAARVPVIGVLLTGNPEPNIFLKGFQEALWEAGYVDGQNIRLEVRSAEGKSSLLSEKAAELAGLKVEIIVASLTPAI